MRKTISGLSLFAGVAAFLAATPVFATQLSFLNQSGKTLCLDFERTQTSSAGGFDYQEDTGWYCFEAGDRSPSFNFDGTSYVGIISVDASGNTNEYASTHDLGYESDYILSWMGDTANSQFGLEYWQTDDGNVHYYYRQGTEAYLGEYIATADDANSAIDNFLSQLDALGFYTESAWTLNSEQLGNTATITLPQ